MASREECRTHLENVGHSDDMDMNDEWTRDIERWDEANDQTLPTEGAAKKL